MVENADEPDNGSEGANDEATESEGDVPNEEESIASDERAMVMAAENNDNSTLKIIPYLLG
jgi:hypothetical protein